VPGNADAARRTLSAVVNDLKKDSAFARVDLLSEDLRRNLADPKVILSDRHFALALDFANTEFQQTVELKKTRTAAPGRFRPRLTPPGNPEDEP